MKTPIASIRLFICAALLAVLAPPGCLARDLSETEPPDCKALARELFMLRVNRFCWTFKHCLNPGREPDIHYPGLVDCLKRRAADPDVSPILKYRLLQAIKSLASARSVLLKAPTMINEQTKVILPELEIERGFEERMKPEADDASNAAAVLAKLLSLRQSGRLEYLLEEKDAFQRRDFIDFEMIRPLPDPATRDLLKHRNEGGQHSVRGS